MLASIRSKTRGPTEVPPFVLQNKNRMQRLCSQSASQRNTTDRRRLKKTWLIMRFECSLVAAWRCLVLLFPCAQHSCSGVLPRKLACQAKARTAQLKILR